MPPDGPVRSRQPVQRSARPRHHRHTGSAERRYSWILESNPAIASCLIHKITTRTRPVTAISDPNRLLARPYRDLHRRTREVELLAQLALDEPDVPGIQQPRREQHELRRAHAGLSGEQDPWRPAATDRVRGRLDQRGDPLVQLPGRHPAGPVVQRRTQRRARSSPPPGRSCAEMFTRSAHGMRRSSRSISLSR